MKACKHCEQEFSPRHGHQVYCCDDCKFLCKFNIGADNECWMWHSTKQPNGYGVFGLGVGANQYSEKAHRYSYKKYIGDIPKGMYVCHSCDEPSCVNPEHLFIGSSFDNTQDMFRKGRANKCSGEKHPMAKLTKRQVQEIRSCCIKYHKEFGLTPLAKRFGVAIGTISLIVNHKNWKNS